MASAKRSKPGVSALVLPVSIFELSIRRRWALDAQMLSDCLTFKLRQRIPPGDFRSQQLLVNPEPGTLLVTRVLLNMSSPEATFAREVHR